MKTKKGKHNPNIDNTNCIAPHDPPPHMKQSRNKQTKQAKKQKKQTERNPETIFFPVALYRMASFPEQFKLSKQKSLSKHKQVETK